MKVRTPRRAVGSFRPCMLVLESTSNTAVNGTSPRSNVTAGLGKAAVEDAELFLVEVQNPVAVPFDRDVQLLQIDVDLEIRRHRDRMNGVAHGDAVRSNGGHLDVMGDVLLTHIQQNAERGLLDDSDPEPIHVELNPFDLGRSRVDLGLDLHEAEDRDPRLRTKDGDLELLRQEVWRRQQVDQGETDGPQEAPPDCWRASASCKSISLAWARASSSRRSLANSSAGSRLY